MPSGVSCFYAVAPCCLFGFQNTTGKACGTAANLYLAIMQDVGALCMIPCQPRSQGLSSLHLSLARVRKKKDGGNDVGYHTGDATSFPS